MYFLIYLLLLILVFVTCALDSIRVNEALRNTDISHCRWNHKPYSIKAFWLNLDKNQDRASYMESQFVRINMEHQRVIAITPNSSEFIVDKLEQPCKRNTPKDIAVILSHLKAIHTAVYSHASNKDSLSDYALILEDDVKFLYDIDFTALINSAPANFGVLQLITSNVEALNSLYGQYKDSTIDNLWKKTAWNHFTKNGKTSLYWSAQAYIINKKVIKGMLDDVIIKDPKTGLLHFKIINSFFPNKCKRTTERPCVLSNCLFADSYIFSAGEPTYISTIPLFSGAKVGYMSTIHQEQVSFHQEAFSLIKSINHDLVKASASGNTTHGLPLYARVPECITLK